MRRRQTFSQEPCRLLCAGILLAAKKMASGSSDSSLNSGKESKLYIQNVEQERMTLFFVTSSQVFEVCNITLAVLSMANDHKLSS